MPNDTEFAGIELAMNHAGEMTALSRLVRPDVAIITTVAAVHLEFFEHVADIADAKAEIFDGMDGSGIAILNRDNIRSAESRGGKECVSPCKSRWSAYL